MKIKSLMLATILGLGIMSAMLKAQTSINIQQFSDSTWISYCPVPVQVNFVMYGQATNYAPNAPMNISVDFGDGNTYSNTVNLSSGWFSDWSISNTYNFSGIFSLRCIVTGPDLNADTAYYSIIAGDTCGTITGKMYVDANSNCNYNAGEILLAGMPVRLMQGSVVAGYSYTDQTGDYAFNVPSSFTYDVIPAVNINNYGYVTTCPPSGQYTGVTAPSSNLDFGMNCLPGFDLVALNSGTGFRPGFTATVRPKALNTFCQPVSGQLELILDPLTSYVSSIPVPVSVNGDTLRWNFSNLNNSNYWNSWNAFAPAVTVYTSLSAQIGDTVCFTTNVTPLSGDVNTANNTNIFCIDVRNSWDPNMKQVSPIGEGPNGNLAPGTYDMDYTVHFQNTGNDTAYQIFILDTLDSDLDAATFQAISSTHNMEVDILPGNVLKFFFPNIMLPDSNINAALSNGHVTYTIRTKPSLPVGTQIKNTARIYFDFNPAIVTNTTLNTIAIPLGVNENANAIQGITVYPNPASSQVLVTLTNKQVGAQLILVDALGRQVISEKTTQQEVSLNVSHLPAGIYNLIIKSDKQIASGRVILIK